MPGLSLASLVSWPDSCDNRLDGSVVFEITVRGACSGW